MPLVLASGDFHHDKRILQQRPFRKWPACQGMIRPYDQRLMLHDEGGAAETIEVLNASCSTRSAAIASRVNAVIEPTPALRMIAAR